MPRGRHRHPQPLHRVLAPATVTVAALLCAGGAWLFGDAGAGDTDTLLLRACSAGAAAAAVTGAVLLRAWDREAGKRVSELKAKQASTEWRAEERQAELEGELDEIRRAREKTRGRLRDKRSELARLRSEHAGLLRRYAHAETERASALEGRRQLQLESGAPTKALTAAGTDHRHPSGAPTPLTYLQANEALRNLNRNLARKQEREEQEREERQREERELREQERGSARQAVLQKPRPALEERRAAEQESGTFDFFGTAGAGKPKRRAKRKSEVPDESEAQETDKGLQPPVIGRASREEKKPGEPKEPVAKAGSDTTAAAPGRSARHARHGEAEREEREEREEAGAAPGEPREVPSVSGKSEPVQAPKERSGGPAATGKTEEDRPEKKSEQADKPDSENKPESGVEPEPKSASGPGKESEPEPDKNAELDKDAEPESGPKSGHAAPKPRTPARSKRKPDTGVRNAS